MVTWHFLPWEGQIFVVHSAHPTVLHCISVASSQTLSVLVLHSSLRTVSQHLAVVEVYLITSQKETSVQKFSFKVPSQIKAKENRPNAIERRLKADMIEQVDDVTFWDVYLI